MITRLNDRINNRIDLAVSEDANALRTSVGNRQHGQLLEIYLERAQAQFGTFRLASELACNASRHLSAGHDVEDNRTFIQQSDAQRREAVEFCAEWLHECYLEIFYSEVMMRITPEGKARNDADAALLKTIKKVYKFVASVVHVLEQDDRDPIFTELNGELAEFIARGARNTLGPLDDDRYHHPDRSRWITIHARSKRRMARLWLRAAQADEEAVKAFARI